MTQEFPKVIESIILNYVTEVKWLQSADRRHLNKNVYDIIQKNSCLLCKSFDKFTKIPISLEHKKAEPTHYLRLCDSCKHHFGFEMCYFCSIYFDKEQLYKNYKGTKITSCIPCINHKRDTLTDDQANRIYFQNTFPRYAEGGDLYPGFDLYRFYY